MAGWQALGLRRGGQGARRGGSDREYTPRCARQTAGRRRPGRGGDLANDRIGTLAVDFGRKAYIELMASKDAAIRRVLEEGYDFATNAFTSEARPAGVRVKDAATVASQLEQEGYLIELCPAYNETGDPIPGMQSVWRKRRGARSP